MAKRIFDIIFRTKGTDKAKSAVSGLGSAIGGITKGAALAGAGIAALSVKLAGDFSKNLREVSTLMKKTSESDMRQMSQELRALSQTSGLALGSLSRAKYDVVSAGFSDAADSARILAETTRLAVGGVTSAASAADILTTALNAFGLSASEVGDVSDTLFTTVRLGKTTMDELGASLGTVLPIARSAKLDFAGVGAAIASLTAGGIGTAEATTALRGALVALTAPTDAAKKELQAAGKEAKFFDDGSLDLLSTIKQFEGLDPAALRKFIPDIQASVAVSALASNVKGLNNNLQSFQERSGATEKAFGQMAEEFNVQMSMLRNSAQSVMIEIGDVIIDAILPAVKSANKILQDLGAIGFDVVGERLIENLDVIKNIAIQSFEILAAELGIIGQKMIRILPGFLGGSDKKANENIEAYERQIKDRLAVIKFEVGLLRDEITKPVPTPEVPPPAIIDVDFDDMMLPDMVLDSFEEYTGLMTEAEVAAINLKVAQLDQAAAAQQSKKAMEETAVAAALNASSAEDAMERVVRAAFMEALAKQIAKIMTVVPFPFNLAVAAGAGATLTGLFDQGMAQVKKLKFAQFGMDEMVSQPTLIMAGEAGPERVQVTPADRPASESSGGLTINFNGPVTSKDFVRDTIIPEIRNVQKLGLA